MFLIIASISLLPKGIAQGMDANAFEAIYSAINLKNASGILSSKYPSNWADANTSLEYIDEFNQGFENIKLEVTSNSSIKCVAGSGHVASEGCAKGTFNTRADADAGKRKMVSQGAREPWLRPLTTL